MIPEIMQRKREIDALCRRYHVRRLELFGSASTGRDIAPESDLDFLVEFKPLPSGAYADTYFGLLEALESLFSRSVDLVAAAAIDNPYFLESIERTKALLYAA